MYSKIMVDKLSRSKNGTDKDDNDDDDDDDDTAMMTIVEINSAKQRTNC